MREAELGRPAPWRSCRPPTGQRSAGRWSLARRRATSSLHADEQRIARLAPVVDARCRPRDGSLGRASATASASAGSASAPVTSGDQLAAGAEHPVDDGARDRRRGRSRSPRSRRRRCRARRRPGRRRPSSRPARPATVTPPWRQWPAAAVIATTSSSNRRSGSCTASAASAWTLARVGITATRSPSSRACARRPRRRRGCRRRWAARRRRGAGPRARRRASRAVDARRPGPPCTTVAPAASNSAAEPVAGHHRHDAAALGGQLAGRRRRGGVAEVGDPDAVRPARLDAGLDGGADVVDVDVDVPGRLAADDDQRVAERGERRAQRGDRRRPARRAGT